MPQPNIKFVICVFLFPICLFAQRQTKLTLIDSETNEPVVFANVAFNNKRNIGTVSDIDGVFYIKDKTVDSITISHLNYERLNLDLSRLTSSTILLTPKTDVLDEVVINSTENPAHRIIRNVLANKPRNNPLNIPSFTYTTYSKIVLDTAEEKPSDTVRDFLKDKYFFITETIAKHSYLKPNLQLDSVIATRTSGLKNPTFPTIAKDFQPFSFYDEYFTLLTATYLNPLNNQTFRYYKFRLEEEILKGQDTVFVISFEPKKGRNFDGLKGVLHINSNKYAVQNVDAEPFEQGKTWLKIQQKYSFIDDQWFPEQLNFIVKLGKAPLDFKYTGKSYISEVNINANLNKKDFPFETLTMTKEATKQTKPFWDSYRTDTLNTREERTYVFLDSVGKKYKFDTVLKYGEGILTGQLPLKYVDIDLLKLIEVNKYEDVRLGLGLSTNDDVMKHVSVGGFFGYGFGDKAWKYGGEITANIPDKKNIAFSFGYENNLREAGLNALHKSKGITDFRNWMAERMDQIEAYSFRANLNLVRNFYWTVQLNSTSYTPTYDYRFNSGATLIQSYDVAELNIDLTYSIKENAMSSFRSNMGNDTDHPVFNFKYSRGIKGLFNGDFNYNKFAFNITHGFRLRNFGKTNYTLNANYIDSSIPYGLLITGEGAYTNDILFIVNGKFQTMRLYEFLSNASIDLFTTHNFGGLLFKAGRFQPDVVVHNNIGYGSLKSVSDHENVSFDIKNEVYLETGLELKSLVKINYLNMGYLGLGIGGFYRYGYYNLPDFEDNFALKFGLSFSIR